MTPSSVWFAAFLFCAFIWFALRFIATLKDAEDARRWTRVALVVGMVYVVLWALQTSGPFVAWR